MAGFTHTEILIFLGTLGIVLLLSRLLGEAGRRFGLPVVLGEIMAGILLGPTLFGALAPELAGKLFPAYGMVAWAWEGLIYLSAVLLLFTAGMEVQLPQVLRQGRRTLFTGVLTFIIPLALGAGLVYLMPSLFGRNNIEIEPEFALFIGVLLAVTALPVIARILMDLKLFKTETGMLIIGAAIFNDLASWLLFSFLLSLLTPGLESGIWYTLLYIMGFGLLMLTVGKRLIDRSLPWVQTRLSWPGGVLSVLIGVGLLCAAFTQAIGLHAILGAFIAGIAFGDSVHLHEKAREIIHQFITNFFAPLFFISIGLHLNFIAHFNITLTAVLILLAVAGKLSGAVIGCSWGGYSFKRSAAVGIALSSGGTMSILLGSIAYGAGMINDELMVSVVIMSLVTAVLCAPVLKSLLK